MEPARQDFTVLPGLKLPHPPAKVKVIFFLSVFSPWLEISEFLEKGETCDGSIECKKGLTCQLPSSSDCIKDDKCEKKCVANDLRKWG